MTPMRCALLAIAVGLLAQSGLAAPAMPTRTVPCDEAIDITRFPYLGNSRPEHRYRTILGAISVPPAFMQQIVPTGLEPWSYWRKAGLDVRNGSGPVTITVPSSWRTRVGFSWGNAGHGVFSTLRIARCGSDPTAGYAYAGGFYIRARGACVPLTFHVGRRSQTVWFGVGRRC